MTKLLLSLLLFLGSQLLVLGQESAAKDKEEASPYKIDYTAMKDIGRDLLEQLKPSFRGQLSANPVWVLDEERPYTKPFQFTEGTVPTRIIYVTEGFLRLANGIAHAKAIDKLEKGFFDRYVAALAQQSEEQVLPVLPLVESRFWSDDVMNEQAGYLNQIVGAVVAIDLAHHYLAHYERYAGQLHDSALSPVTMASTCTGQEWELAFKLGAGNALECGFGFEGIKALFDCVDRMPKRPGWTLYFLPAKANVVKLKKELDKIENRFFGQI